MLLVAMVSVQLGASVAKQLFAELGAAGTSTLRAGIAALLLLAVNRPWRAWPRGSALKAIGFYGVTLGLMNLSFYFALERIPLGIAVAIEFVGPLAVAILSSRQALDLLWAALAAAGIVALLPLTEAAGRTGALDPVGIGLALVAAVCWALYIVFGQRAGALAGSGTVTSIGMAVAALVVTPFGVHRAGMALLSPKTLPFAAAVALLSSAVPYSLEMHALKSLPRRTFGILMSIEPAMAALFGFLMLGETLQPVQWGAVACIMAASAGSTVSAGRQKRPQVVPA